MKSRFLLPCLLALAACGSSPESRFYTLAPSKSPETVLDPSYDAQRFTLATVAIPGVLDKPQMVMKKGDHEIEVLEYDRWAEPLDGMITRILADNLVSRGAWSIPAEDAPVYSHRLSVAIDELDADQSGRVVLMARWTVSATGKASEGNAKSHSFEKSAMADGDDISSIVAAESKLLGDLAEAILSE